MKIADHVHSALADWDAGRFESALTHACIAVDGTARRMFPTLGNRKRYIRCLRHFYWMIEPALGAGIDLEKTKFSNVRLNSTIDPDLAEIIYEVFRCAHAHGDEVPAEFDLILGAEGAREWVLGDGVCRLPHTLLFALLFVAVFAPVNRDERPLGNAFLTLGTGENKDAFLISEWWGRSAALKPFAAKHNRIRVHVIFPPGHTFDPNGPVGHLQIDLTPRPDDKAVIEEAQTGL